VVPQGKEVKTYKRKHSGAPGERPPRVTEAVTSDPEDQETTTEGERPSAPTTTTTTTTHTLV